MPKARAPDPEVRPVSGEDKKLAKDWLDKIKAAQLRSKDQFAQFEVNRRLLAGKIKGARDEKETVRANLHYANMAAMLPQVYAKDPEFAVRPTLAVAPEQLEAVKRFAKAGEAMLTTVLVKANAGQLKKQAKKVVRSNYTTSVGWLKCAYQEDPNKDPLIENRVKDTQDNIQRIEALLREIEDPQLANNHELELAKLKEALAGLEVQQEVKVAKGLPLDFVLSEDILVLDTTIRAITDYQRSSAISHRVWMTATQYKTRFKYAPKSAKKYSEQPGQGSQPQQTDAPNPADTLLCVHEVWSQDDNRIFYVCDGEEGFCEPPSSPDWAGKRWYPFFLVAFNEIDGSFYPLSDVELTDKLVKEYNQNRDDQVRDRKACLPVNVVRKGGALTPDDVKRIANREGSDVIMVEGVGAQPLTNDMFIGQLGKMDAAAYDTTSTRYDMERMLGGSDSSTGSITKAKTLGEAEILTAALRGRTDERRDTIEDMLNELGPYAIEIMLRKYTPEEVKAIAGPEAEWPQLSIDEIFNMVSVEVRAGSTGKPNQAQEQERWTKLLPIVNEAVAKVSELREKGQEALADAVIELTRETLRRFDERIDIEQFLPKKPEGEDDPTMLKQQLVAGQGQMKELMGQLKDATTKLEKGYVQAAASIATSPDPQLAALAFNTVLGEISPEALASLPRPEPMIPAGEGPLEPTGMEPQVSQPTADTVLQ
jgi:hypothetical protein